MITLFLMLASETMTMDFGFNRALVKISSILLL